MKSLKYTHIYRGKICKTLGQIQAFISFYFRHVPMSSMTLLMQILRQMKLWNIGSISWISFDFRIVMVNVFLLSRCSRRRWRWWWCHKCADADDFTGSNFCSSIFVSMCLWFSSFSPCLYLPIRPDNFHLDTAIVIKLV